jgi:hypothetical protein
MTRTPWIGLIALIAMFVIPFLPTWVFEGPHTVKHRVRRHVCGECGEPWIDGHSCAAAGQAGASSPGRLRRLRCTADLQRSPGPRIPSVGRNGVTRALPAPRSRPRVQISRTRNGSSRMS